MFKVGSRVYDKNENREGTIVELLNYCADVKWDNCGILGRYQYGDLELIESDASVEYNVITYLINRTDGTFTICLIPQKDKKIYQFVNMTKGHICPCEFDSIKSAEQDFSKHENIIDWRRIK
jgi:hypothetical protein